MPRVVAKTRRQLASVDSLHFRLSDLAAADVAGLLHGRDKYGDSWRKRGGWEAFANLSRKWDRIERAVEEETDKDVFKAIREHPASDGRMDGKDSLLDDIRDLRRYLLLVDEYVTRPDNAFSVGERAPRRKR